MPAARRHAFTLVELLASLAVVGVLFVMMLLLIDQLRDSRDRLLSLTRRDNRVSNGRRVLRDLLERADARGDSTHRFAGYETATTFLTWCDVPGGWLERCAAQVQIISLDDSAFVQAVLSTGEHLDLLAARGPMVFRYFDASLPDPAWVSGWGRSSSLPAALAIVAGRDTTVLRIRGRG